VNLVYDSLDVTLKTTEQNLIVRIRKSEVEVTKDYAQGGIVLLKLYREARSIDRESGFYEF